MLPQSAELLDLGSPSSLVPAPGEPMPVLKWLFPLCAPRYQVSRSMSAFKPLSQLHRICYDKAALFMYHCKHHWAAFSSMPPFNELFSKAGDWLIRLMLQRALIGDMPEPLSSETMQIFLSVLQSSSAFDKYIEAPGSWDVLPSWNKSHIPFLQAELE